LWREYEGGITDWLTQRARARVTATSAPAPASRSPAATTPAKPKKLSYKEQRELDALPARIEALEAEQKQVAADVADPALYVKDPQRAAAANARATQIDVELTAALERWESLGSR
jgi:ABC transport system ATP-binding/permease protein